MSPRSEVIDDSTDPGGTLRPNLPPEPTIETYFTLLQYPEFEYYINLLPNVDAHNPIAIFDLFFTLEQILILVENTNRSGPYWRRIGPRNAQALKWKDILVEELYTYLGILIYMGLHPENDIDQYWYTDINNYPSHGPVYTAMARDQWKQISQAFYISGKGKSAFLKVCNYVVSWLFTNKSDRSSP